MEILLLIFASWYLCSKRPPRFLLCLLHEEPPTYLNGIFFFHWQRPAKTGTKKNWDLVGRMVRDAPDVRALIQHLQLHQLSVCSPRLCRNLQLLPTMRSNKPQPMSCPPSVHTASCCPTRQGWALICSALKATIALGQGTSSPPHPSELIKSTLLSGCISSSQHIYGSCNLLKYSSDPGECWCCSSPTLSLSEQGADPIPPASTRF